MVVEVEVVAAVREVEIVEVEIILIVGGVVVVVVVVGF